MIVFKSEYNLGDIVFLKTDPEQLERIIIMVSFKGNGNVVYSLGCGSSGSDHYSLEISSKKDLMKELNITGTAPCS